MRGTDFDGKVAIVTGGASGIGAALAAELARGGAEVVLADRQVELAGEVAAAIRARGGRAEVASLDVRDLEAWSDLARSTVSRCGRVDYLFNNAGIGVGGEMEHYDARDWDDVFDVNLRGVAYGVQAIYPHMVAARSGHIVNTASVAGLVSAAGEGSYTASKHAVVGLSKSLRVEAKRHGVRVSVLCPGAIRTPILSGGRFGRINFKGFDATIADELWAAARPMPADAFARDALAAIVANEPIIVIPRWWKAFWYAERLSPALGLWIWEKLLDRLRAQMAAHGVEPILRRERKDGPS
jgi:NAD(P)-dependent dehydrogenase (short-subunit alcohol dehydrogenase family)